MSLITTHVLDTALGQPAVGIPVKLEFSPKGDSWKTAGQTKTNKDGRAPDLLAKDFEVKKGIYRITFELEKYFSGQKRKSFYPHATIVFEIENPAQHHHVPLLVSGFGYSTYRGS